MGGYQGAHGRDGDGEAWLWERWARDVEFLGCGRARGVRGLESEGTSWWWVCQGGWLMWFGCENGWVGVTKLVRK